MRGFSRLAVNLAGQIDPMLQRGTNCRWMQSTSGVVEAPGLRGGIGIGAKVVIGIPCLLRGGTEQQTLSLARALKGFADEITVLCYFEKDPSVVMDFIREQVSVQCLQLSRDCSRITVLKALRSAFVRLNPNVVHIQYLMPGFMAVLAARLSTAPRVIATVHQAGTGFRNQTRWILQTAALLCDRFVCVSKAAEQSWFGTTGKAYRTCLLGNHCTMHNCVDLDRINRVVAQTVRDARPRAFPSGGLVVGCVTRLHREKGVDVLLEAFPGVVALVPSARLLIVGDGPDRELLRARSGELGLSHRIIWAGRQMWKQAIELADQMDIVVVPSRFEGFGLSAIEAMALSKPVVAANVGGLAEVIGDEGCGMLVPPENPRALTETIVSLWRNPEQRLAVANAARHRVEARFSFQRYRQDVLVLYSDLLATSDVNAFASPSGALS